MKRVIMRPLNIRASLIALSLTALPALALASEGAEHGSHGVETLFLPVVNFVIYLALLIYFVRKPIVSGWEKRRLDIENLASRGEKELAEAQRQLQEVQVALQGVEQRVQEISLSLTKASEEEVKQIIVEAQNKAQATVEQANRKVAAESRALEDTLRKELLEQVLRSAEKLVQGRASAASDKARRDAAYRGVARLVQ